MLNLDFLNNDYDQKKSINEKVTEAVAIEILTGSLRPGKRIVEQKLCDKYGISRTPVRDVLKSLESMGLIELLPNRGAIVKGLSSRDIDDILYMKSLLYPQCVRWAIRTDHRRRILHDGRDLCIHGILYGHRGF